MDTTASSTTVVAIISTMTIMMNYLSGSFYESQFTYTHERARANLNEIYERISNTPSIAPSVIDVRSFYASIIQLWCVIDTDDIDYSRYMRQLRRYINKPPSTTSEPEKTTKSSGEEEGDGNGNGKGNGKGNGEGYVDARSILVDSDSDSESYTDDDDIDWSAREREEWTQSIRSKKY
jgi:hypothetical protein